MHYGRGLSLSPCVCVSLITAITALELHIPMCVMCVHDMECVCVCLDTVQSRMYEFICACVLDTCVKYNQDTVLVFRSAALSMHTFTHTLVHRIMCVVCSMPIGFSTAVWIAAAAAAAAAAIAVSIAFLPHVFHLPVMYIIYVRICLSLSPWWY